MHRDIKPGEVCSLGKGDVCRPHRNGVIETAKEIKALRRVLALRSSTNSAFFVASSPPELGAAALAGNLPYAKLVEENAFTPFTRLDRKNYKARFTVGPGNCDEPE